jgi:hypothetical protein
MLGRERRDTIQPQWETQSETHSRFHIFSVIRVLCRPPNPLGVLPFTSALSQICSFSLKELRSSLAKDGEEEEEKKRIRESCKGSIRCLVEHRTRSVIDQRHH